MDDANDDMSSQDRAPYYVEQIMALRDYVTTTLFVDFTHVLRHEEVLAKAISEQYYR